MASLFVIPMSTEANIVCTEPQPKVYLLTFTVPPDNQVTKELLSALSLSLSLLEHRYDPGVVIVTSGNTKYYSNGFNLEEVTSTPDFFEVYMYPLLVRLLTYPMPTLTIINGHAFGAAIFLAMAFDYRIQNPNRGYACLPEVDLGLTIPPPISVLISKKLPSLAAYRTSVLEGRRFTGPQALEIGLVDLLGGLEETMNFIAEQRLVKRSGLGAIAGLKRDIWRDIICAFDDTKVNDDWKLAAGPREDAQRERSERELADWDAAKSKL